MSQILRHSTATVVVIGPAVAVGDGFTPVTNLTLTGADEAELLKASTATTTSIASNSFAAITGCDGWYALTLTAGDTGTVGPLTVMVNDDSLILPLFARFQVVSAAAYDAQYADAADPKADINVATIDANAVSATAIADNAITAAKIANGAIDAATFAADVDAEILSYVVDDATRIDASALNTATGTTVPAIVADTNELQTDWANGGRLDLILDARASQTSVDTIDDFLDTEITAILDDTNELQTDWTNGGRLDLLIDAIKAKTDNLPTDPADASDVAAAIAALNDVSAAEVNAEVVDALAADLYVEPAGVPPMSNTLAAKIGYLYMALRNAVTVTATKKQFLDDGGAAEWEKDLSDDGTTYTESEGNAP